MQNRITSHLIEASFKEAMRKCGYGRRTLRTELITESELQRAGFVAVPFAPDFSHQPSVGSVRVVDCGELPERWASFCFWVGF